MPYNSAADSFHTKKLCSRLSSSEVRFYTEIGRFAFLRPSFPLGIGTRRKRPYDVQSVCVAVLIAVRQLWSVLWKLVLRDDSMQRLSAVFMGRSSSSSRR